MGSWVVIESYHRFGDPYISCVVAVCPEEMKGKKSSSEISWRIYSKQTTFESREEAEDLAETARGLYLLQTPSNLKQNQLELPCGCLVNLRGRAATCGHWRRAGGALGYKELIFPAELYEEVRRHVIDLEWQKPKVWDRMKSGISQHDDIGIIASKLKKHPDTKRKVLQLRTPRTMPLMPPPIVLPAFAKF